MYFLPRSGQITAEDLVAGRVTRTRDAAGRAFDWLQITEGVLAIKSGAEPPNKASGSIFPIAMSSRLLWREAMLPAECARESGRL